MSDRERQALCCVCGSVRTCRRARNHREENYWLKKPVDLDWSRELGDLKCAECNKVTTHALLHPEGDWAAEHAEMLQQIGLGGEHPHGDGRLYEPVRDRIRDRYRQSNFPVNPFVHHRWWKADENRARDAGKQWFAALCGEPIAVPETPRDGSDITEFDAPTHVTDPERAEHENFDPDTGIWWTGDGVCVNCLRIRNDWLLAKRRKHMVDWLRWLGKHPDRVPDGHVESLIAVCQAAAEVSEPAADKKDADR